ncbi:hypothetical protein Hypma_004241 [Hypsizygus marmoreus]|uniref:Uncharacterized protein n=1 Tax=Hypsizygus marmoreus TaxID=39966 RepID=A0A369J545_HYPMA|nr:hypothetical protein Hypma_004241 [Hypsizygus marmoreus]
MWNFVLRKCGLECASAGRVLGRQRMRRGWRRGEIFEDEKLGSKDEAEDFTTTTACIEHSPGILNCTPSIVVGARACDVAILGDARVLRMMRMRARMAHAYASLYPPPNERRRQIDASPPPPHLLRSGPSYSGDRRSWSGRRKGEADEEWWWGMRVTLKVWESTGPRPHALSSFSPLCSTPASDTVHRYGLWCTTHPPNLRYFARSCSRPRTHTSVRRSSSEGVGWNARMAGSCRGDMDMREREILGNDKDEGEGEVGLNKGATRVLVSLHQPPNELPSSHLHTSSSASPLSGSPPPSTHPNWAIPRSVDYQCLLPWGVRVVRGRRGSVYLWSGGFRRVKY